MKNLAKKNLTLVFALIVTLVLVFLLEAAHCGSDCYGKAFWIDVYEPALAWVFVPVLSLLVIVAIINIFAKIIPENYLDKIELFFKILCLVMIVVIFLSPYSYLSFQYNLGIEFLYSDTL